MERAARKALTYQADMRRAAQLAEAEEWSSLGTLLDQYRPAPGETDLRAWEWHFLDSLLRKIQLVDRQEAVLQGPTTGVHQLSWSGNGQRLTVVGEDGSAGIWDLKTGKELRRIGARIRVACLDQDGKAITLSADNGTVSLCGTDGGPARRVFGRIQGLFNDRQPAFSPDGQRLALAVGKTVAAVYDTSSGRERHRLAGHQDFISAVAWRPDGKVLATGGRDGVIRLWDADAGNETATLDADDHVDGLQWRIDGRQLAAVTSRGQGTGQVRIWDVARRQKIFAVEAQYGTTWRPNQPRAGLFLSADGWRVAAESNRGVSVWETSTGRPIFQGPSGASGSQLGGCDPEVRRWAFLQMFGNRATCRVVEMDSSAELFRVQSEIPMNDYRSALAWSPDGKRFAAGFSQGKVYVYRAPSQRADVRMVNAGPAPLFEWSRDGRRFAFSTSGETRIGSLPATEPPIRLGPPLLLPTTISLSPDGRYLAGAESDGTLPIWDVSSGQVARRLPGHPAPHSDRPTEARIAADALSWSPDAEQLLSLRSADGDLRIWDVKGARQTTSFQFGVNEFEVRQHESLPLVWSPDSKFVAARTGWQQKLVRIIDTTTGKQTRQWDGGPSLGSCNSMSWDSTSQKLATGLGNPPRVQVWDVTTGRELLTLDGEVPGLRQLSWSPDGRRLAYQAESTRIYDSSTKTTISLAGTGEYLIWNPDGSRLALVGNGSFTTRFGSRSIEVYDAATGTEIPGERRTTVPELSAMKRISGGVEGQNYEIRSAVWPKEGMRVAATAMAYPGMGIIVVWDAQTGNPLLTLGQVYDALADRAKVARMVSWAPDSRSLATLAGESNSDAQIGVWDATTGRKIHTIVVGRINFRGAAGLAWSPDGRSVAFAGQQVQVWNLGRPLQPQTFQGPTGGGREADQSFLAWSPDGRSLALLECRHTAGREMVIRVWDVATTKEQFHAARPHDFSSLHSPIAWSPDGKRLACGGSKPEVWNVAAGKEAFSLAGHSSAVIDVEWSQDGRRVLSRCEVIGPFTRSFELKVWDASSGQEVLMLRGPMAGWRPAPGFQGLASPAGSGTDAGDVVVWDLGPRK
jgi:WD40 repeat protein